MSAIHSTKIFGEELNTELFNSTYAKAFAKYMSGPEIGETARILKCFSRAEFETVLIEVEVVLPQHPLADIHSKEIIACVFDRKDVKAPETLAMRTDFPRLPHQGLATENFPKFLCLDATQWSESKYRWSASGFLEAIRSWLARATTGKLHAPGQPREPLLLNPDGYLIIPSDLNLDDLKRLELSGDINVSPAILWASRMNDGKPARGRFKAICFRLPDREHGIIESRPDTLMNLDALCQKGGFDLLGTISDSFKNGLVSDGADKSGLRLDLLLVLHWNVTGQESPEIVSHEEWAFVIKDAAHVGEALGVLMCAEGMMALAVSSQQRNNDMLAKIKVSPLAILKRLDSDRALAASGLTRKYPSVAVLGIGALGSRCIEILTRQGLSKGVLIDHDRLLPHNTSRHVLLGYSVGYHKAVEMESYLNSIHEPCDEKGDIGFTAIKEQFTLPLNVDVQGALQAVEQILDFSASVAVSRGLSTLNNISRCTSSFLTPGADTLFIHVEDRKRNIRLDWLEGIALRAIIENERLGDVYLKEGSNIWYGGPCREVSTILPNENVVLFAAAWAGFFTRHHVSEDALCIAYKMNLDTMELSMVGIPVSKPYVNVINGWTIKYDEVLIDQLKKFRSARLPNETGGVLIGIIDRERKTCCVLIGSDSPLDSDEWPESYVRGVTGLKSYVDEVSEKTAGQLSYIGEWHSHPNGISSAPSNTDLRALDTLTSKMMREGLPAIAFVIGEEAEPSILVGWNEDRDK